MIIVDFSAISIASVFSQPANTLDESMIRHFILNSLRMYNVKYRSEYGEMVIACDHRSWRKSVYPEYKAARKKNREKSKIDWTEVFGMIDKVKEELREFFPYPVLHVNGAEADDIVATLVESTQEFGKHEKVMIVSSDKDFIQLQKYSNVKQFSPGQKKAVTDPSPTMYLFEHVLRGDSGDGVPNVLSSDDTFVTAKRQTPLSKVKIKKWHEESKTKDLKDVLDETTYRNYIRNQTMIDLSKIPSEVVSDIQTEYQKEESNKNDNSKILNYLIQNRCNQLVNCADEFFIK